MNALDKAIEDLQEVVKAYALGKVHEFAFVLPANAVLAAYAARPSPAVSADLQLDIDEIDMHVRLNGIKADEDAWQRIRARLTAPAPAVPDRELVAKAIASALNDHVSLIDSEPYIAADAAIAALAAAQGVK